MESKEITEALFKLIELTATELPGDVTAALDKCSGLYGRSGGCRGYAFLVLNRIYRPNA